MIPTLLGRLAGRLFENDRGVRRFRLAALAIAANVISKAFALAVVVISTRIALGHLGAERFGVWTTIASVATLLGFVDLGVSNALLNRVAELHASSERSMGATVTRGLVALAVAGGIAAGLLAACFYFAPMTAWFKGIAPDVAEQARATGYSFAIFFGLSLPAQGIAKIYAGLQQGWVAHSATAIAWIASIVLLNLAPAIDAPMWFYLAATFGVQQLVLLLLATGLARRGFISLAAIGGRWLDELKGDALMLQGRLFLVIQITAAIVWGSNQLILSAVTGPADAAQFSVLQRYFMVLQVGLAVVNGPLWVMYADARAHSDTLFIRELLQRSMLLTLAVSLAGVILLSLNSGMLMPLLSGGKVAITQRALLLMAVWTVLEAGGNAYAMYLNGVGAIRPQVITGFAYMVTSVPLKVYGVRHFGVEGMLIVMIASYVLFTIVPMLTVFRAECMDVFNRNRQAGSAGGL